MSENTVFTAKMRSDKRKNQELKSWRYMTYEELKARPYHVNILDRHGDVAEVHITTIKTWKTRPQIEIHCKFGLYEYFTVTVYPDRQQQEFVIEVTE